MGVERGQPARICLCDSSASVANKKFPIQWVPDTVSPGVKRTGREADHSPPSSVDVKDSAAMSPLPPYVFMARCSIN
jgi:hypothetical protein